MVGANDTGQGPGELVTGRNSEELQPRPRSSVSATFYSRHDVCCTNELPGKTCESLLQERGTILPFKLILSLALIMSSNCFQQRMRLCAFHNRGRLMQKNSAEISVILSYNDISACWLWKPWQHVTWVGKT
ncbi:hypothetical protein Y1Q_0003089 [Alligator mississippiensis]|uniref:Uncharacterized protein n=1 Tax=Alligator mississippiensis TaxID=8496 RepID=A0A151MDD8_ALLMI|nr:hypothetical protein Y1Q_0003089 [Alligator mississippiensis]